MPPEPVPGEPRVGRGSRRGWTATRERETWSGPGPASTTIRPGTEEFENFEHCSTARIIATATALLDPAEARRRRGQASLDRAARLTPGGLRAAIARAVIEVAPEKAKERRETAAKFARVERWARTPATPP